MISVLRSPKLKQRCFSDETLPETGVEYAVPSNSSGLAFFQFQLHSNDIPSKLITDVGNNKPKQYRVFEVKKQAEN